MIMSFIQTRGKEEEGEEETTGKKSGHEVRLARRARALLKTTRV